jgi:hypothetical protein
MSPKARQNFLGLVGLVLVAAVLLGVFVAIRGAFRIFASLNSDIAVAIIAAAATVFVSVLSIVLGKVYEARERIQKEHREKKIPVYDDLIRFMFRVMMVSKTGDSPTEKETLDFVIGFNQRIMIWGADEVLAAWVKWRRFATEQAAASPEPLKLLFLYEEVILAIRRDLGHKNKGLKRSDILALFVNDIGKQLAPAGN